MRAFSGGTVLLTLLEICMSILGSGHSRQGDPCKSQKAAKASQHVRGRTDQIQEQVRKGEDTEKKHQTHPEQIMSDCRIPHLRELQAVETDGHNKPKHNEPCILTQEDKTTSTSICCSSACHRSHPHEITLAKQTTTVNNESIGGHAHSYLEYVGSLVGQLTN